MIPEIPKIGISNYSVSNSNYTVTNDNIAESASGKIPGPVTDSQDTNISFGDLMVSKLLKVDGSVSKVEGHIIRNTGNVRVSSVDVVVNGDGKVVNLNANNVANAIQNENWTEIKSSELKTAGYLNIHNIDFEA